MYAHRFLVSSYMYTEFISFKRLSNALIRTLHNVMYMYVLGYMYMYMYTCIGVCHLVRSLSDCYSSCCFIVMLYCPPQQWSVATFHRIHQQVRERIENSPCKVSSFMYGPYTCH